MLSEHHTLCVCAYEEFYNESSFTINTENSLALPCPVSVLCSLSTMREEEEENRHENPQLYDLKIYREGISFN